MIRVICDKCGADCDANAFAIAVEVIHNPTPRHPTDFGNIKITDDKSYMRMCLCQKCYRGLGFPNIYEVTRTKSSDGETRQRKEARKMAIKPILFNSEMVRAILDGRKTQTRRVVKPQPSGQLVPEPDGGCWSGYFAEVGTPRVVNPPYRPGDVLWVRETWDDIPVSPGGQLRFSGRYYYKADGDIRPVGWKGNWRSARFMPKKATRIFLLAKAIRVERLGSMSEEDAMAEGFADSPAGTDSPLEMFSVLWDKTIKREDFRECGVHANRKTAGGYLWRYER